ncbi:MAG: hypothetical protein V5B38_14165 [Candidatus Accumulibacter propinquus]|jgi:hypothetical protein
MRHDNVELRQQILQGLDSCQDQNFPLPGVQTANRCEAFVRQLIDSIRRVRFVSAIASRDIHPDRANGLSDAFDPIRAAILNSRAGNFDEACWLVLLFVHFGRHPVSGYRYTREVYSALGMREPWTFREVKNDIEGVKNWLDRNEPFLRRGNRRGFGNHRKYLSLSGSRQNGTGHAFETYVRWVQAYGGHTGIISEGLNASGNSPESAFEWLYQSMRSVASFGRIGRFDYLTMLQKLGLANIRPGRPYLDSSTKGPNRGARRMLESGRVLSIQELEERVKVLGTHLQVGMQEMEDSLCNWGKNPEIYSYFRG